MNAETHTTEYRNRGFAIGLVAGTWIGACLTMWMAPRVTTEMREHVTNSARRLGQRASGAVGELTREGRRVRDHVAGVVARGAHEVARGAQEVERHATSARTDGDASSGKPQAV